jgi:hypothetical protein
MNETYVYKKVNRSGVVSLILYVDNIIFIENDIFLLWLVKIWLSRNFSMKDILGLKIYKDKSKRLLGLFHSYT